MTISTNDDDDGGDAGDDVDDVSAAAVAVIGVDERRRTLRGRRSHRNTLHRFPSRLKPVDEARSSVLGRTHCSASLRSGCLRIVVVAVFCCCCYSVACLLVVFLGLFAMVVVADRRS